MTLDLASRAQYTAIQVSPKNTAKITQWYLLLCSTVGYCDVLELLIDCSCVHITGTIYYITQPNELIHIT